MTLTTKVRLTPMPANRVHEVWTTCSVPARVPDGIKPIVDREKPKCIAVRSPFGVGALAWVGVYYEDATPDEITVLLDTAYSNDLGPEIHNAIVRALMQAYPECHLVAYNEMEDRWVQGPPH